MKLDPDALKLIEDFETFVPYVYDDGHGMGRGGYREWQGEGVAGTLTIGWGHTNAAGLPHITKGMRITREMGDRILEADLGRVIADVKRFVKVELNPHQFGALVSFHYNSGALGRSNVLARVNAKRFNEVPAALMMWTKTHINGALVESRGLVRRRRAECALWRSSVREIVPPEPDEGNAQRDVVKEAPPKSMIESKTGNAAIVVGGAGAGEVLSQVRDTLDTVHTAKDTASDLGMLGLLQKVIMDPRFIIAVVVVACAVFIWYDRRKRLIEDHV